VSILREPDCQIGHSDGRFRTSQPPKFLLVQSFLYIFVICPFNYDVSSSADEAIYSKFPIEGIGSVPAREHFFSELIRPPVEENLSNGSFMTQRELEIVHSHQEQNKVRLLQNWQ